MTEHEPDAILESIFDELYPERDFESLPWKDIGDGIRLVTLDAHAGLTSTQKEFIQSTIRSAANGFSTDGNPYRKTSSRKCLYIPVAFQDLYTGFTALMQHPDESSEGYSDALEKAGNGFAHVHSFFEHASRINPDALPSLAGAFTLLSAKVNGTDVVLLTPGDETVALPLRAFFTPEGAETLRDSSSILLEILANIRPQQSADTAMMDPAHFGKVVMRYVRSFETLLPLPDDPKRAWGIAAVSLRTGLECNYAFGEFDNKSAAENRIVLNTVRAIYGTDNLYDLPFTHQRKVVDGREVVIVGLGFSTKRARTVALMVEISLPQLHRDLDFILRHEKTKTPFKIYFPDIPTTTDRSYFRPSPFLSDWVYLYLKRRDDFDLHAIRHELTHQLIYAVIDRYHSCIGKHPYISEGLAQYYGTHSASTTYETRQDDIRRILNRRADVQKFTVDDDLEYIAGELFVQFLLKQLGQKRFYKLITKRVPMPRRNPNGDWIDECNTKSLFRRKVNLSPYEPQRSDLITVFRQRSVEMISHVLKKDWTDIMDDFYAYLETESNEIAP